MYSHEIQRRLQFPGVYKDRRWKKATLKIDERVLKICEYVGENCKEYAGENWRREEYAGDISNKNQVQKNK